MSQAPKTPSIRDRYGEFAPKLIDLTEDVLFGRVWTGEALSQRDRSLVTITALVALNRTEQLRPHLVRGVENGLTKDEVVETITQLAFYSGWPTAMSAVAIAKGFFDVTE